MDTPPVFQVITHIYRPQTKLRKGNVFTNVCQEFCPWAVCPRGVQAQTRRMSAGGGCPGPGRVPTRPGKPGKMRVHWKTWKYHGILKNLINIMEK